MSDINEKDLEGVSGGTGDVFNEGGADNPTAEGPGGSGTGSGGTGTVSGPPVGGSPGVSKEEEPGGLGGGDDPGSFGT